MHFLLIIAFLDDLENMALCLQWLTRAFDQIERHQNDHVRHDSGWSIIFLLSALQSIKDAHNNFSWSRLFSECPTKYDIIS